jgi:branched-chain amino acid transport system permease protein
MDDLQAFFDAYQTTIGIIGINAILALSVWLTLYTGQLTLGNAAFMGIAAYGSALLTLKAGFAFPLALLCGALLAAAISLPLGATVFRLRGVYLAIATLAFGEVVRVAILAIPITGRGQGLVGIPPKTELWHIFASLAVIAYLCSRVRLSSVGRAWAAIREDEVAAASQGIPVRRYKLAAFVLGALIAGWAGGLAAHFDRLPAAGPRDAVRPAPHRAAPDRGGPGCCLRRPASRNDSAASSRSTTSTSPWPRARSSV